MTNSIGRAHWSVKAKEARTWKNKVHTECKFLNICDLNLTNAHITITRCSSREPDFDGLVSSGKHLLDGLVQAKVIPDDKVSIIGQPVYIWEHRKIGLGGQMKIKIEKKE